LGGPVRIVFESFLIEVIFVYEIVELSDRYAGPGCTPVDAFGLGFLVLGDFHGQDSVFEPGLDILARALGGQGDGPGELAVASFHPEEIFSLGYRIFSNMRDLVFVGLQVRTHENQQRLFGVFPNWTAGWSFSLASSL